MNFADIYKKIKAIDEGGVALPPEDDPDGSLPAGAFTAADQQTMNNNMSAAAAAPAEPAVPTTPVISLTNGNNGTMNLPDGSSVPVTLYPEGGMQPRMPAGSEKVIASVNSQKVEVWIYGGRGYVRNYGAATMNENSNENFMSLYKQIRAIDEGTTPAPTAPGGVIKTKNADGSVSYKPKVPGERLSGTIPGTDSGAKVSDPDPTAPGGVIKTKNADGSVSYKPKVPGERISKTIPGSGAKVSTSAEEKQPTNEACGDMMALPMGLGQEHSAQQDSVTMNVSMNGSGDGGIRDLMNILKGIENVGEPHADHDAIDVVFGGEMEPEMEAFANSMAGASGQQTFPQSAVTDIGSNSGRADHEVPKVHGGGNPYTQVSEELVNRLSSLYQEIKQQGVAEGYNPNSVDAEHRRGLEKSQEDSLKKKAADGDESAKKRLQALKDKKERMRNDYNDRMER